MSTRTLLLSQPRLVTKKYEGEKPRKWIKIMRPIEPIKSERLDKLSVPNKKTPKWTEPERPTTTINKAALEANLTPRLDHLSRPYVIKLEGTKRHYGLSLGESFVDVMNEKIQMSRDTIYHHNKKYRELALLEKKGAKPPSKKIFNFEENRLESMAAPRKEHEPEPLPKRIKKPVKYFKNRLVTLASPRSIYQSPSQDSFMKRQKRRFKHALKYEITDRVRELCNLPEHRTQKDRQRFQGVRRGALLYEITERVNEIAQPKNRANAPEMDLKENAYEISPAALRYKATPRIIKLAKPIER